MITIFTPTYNRAHLLLRLYKSLLSQTILKDEQKGNNSFEWLVVDDGSRDNTEEVIRSFIAEKKIDIRYIKQKNGGKHQATNTGASEAKGELFLILDSDDYLTDDAVEWLSNEWERIRDDCHFVAIAGLKVFPNGEKIGGGSDFGQIDSDSINIRTKYNVQGDMAEVWRTTELRAHPFPTVEGEKFCSEGLVWRRISNQKLIRYIYKPIYVAEYLPDGLSASVVRIRVNSPELSGINYAEYVTYDVPFKEKLKGAINFWRFIHWSKRSFVSKVKQIGLRWVWTYPIGEVFALKDKRTLKNSK
ncbi:glycosyltransferase family A protein [Prevotella sp. HUN102]|uniref:glycosyltransferase family A protein n=1 Tax=Prevotella sp. HUN102 TaxID=1392486 RepID=UPI00049135C5|nr:glycosyltransferase family A protein [Prevotella sp. HUN102]